MNVIVLVADSLRVDHLGCYSSPGYSSPRYSSPRYSSPRYGSTVQTPNLDRLAAESALLTQAYAENRLDNTIVHIHTDPVAFFEDGQTAGICV